MKNLWEKWKHLSEKIGNFQATVLFSILYFLMVFPYGFISSRFNDYLNIKRFPSWKKFKNNASTLEKLKLQ